MLEKYLCIEPSGEVRWIELERKPRYNAVYNGEEALSLKDLYPILDCSCCEQVRTCLRDIVIMVDESGRIKTPPKPHNEIASQLYLGWHFGGDDICGTAVVFALRPIPPYGEQDIFPLTPDQEEKVAQILGVELPPKEVSGNG